MQWSKEKYVFGVESGASNHDPMIEMGKRLMSQGFLKYLFHYCTTDLLLQLMKEMLDNHPTTCKLNITEITSTTNYAFNLRIHVQKDELLFLGLGPNPNDSTF